MSYRGATFEVKTVPAAENSPAQERGIWWCDITYRCPSKIVDPVRLTGHGDTEGEAIADAFSQFGDECTNCDGRGWYSHNFCRTCNGLGKMVETS